MSIPDRRPLTPDLCKHMAGFLGDAITKLRAWNVRVLDVSRLEVERRLLLDVATRGCYPHNPAQLRQIAHALRDAHEFRYISASMPEARIEQLVKELQRTVGGTPDRRSCKREAYQYQTQFWVGAILGFGNVRPIIPPTSSRRSPDYLLRNGTLSYGVEVKRPETPEGAERQMLSGARQLASAGVGGAVVIDISDCLAPEATEVIHGNESDSAELESAQTFQAIATRLEQLAFDDDRNQPRAEFLPATVMVVMASVFRWRLDDLRYPDLIKLCRFAAFWKNRNTLAYHRTLWLRDILFRGMQATGHNLVSNRDTIDVGHFGR